MEYQSAYEIVRIGSPPSPALTSQYPSSLAKPSKIDQILGQAYAAHQSGQLSEAEKLYRQVLHLNPHDSDAANLLGLLYIESRRFDKARKVIRNAIRSEPDDPQSHYNLGIAMHECGDPGEAIRHFGTAARLAPDNVEAWVALANVQKSSGNAADASDSYRRALAIDRSHAVAIKGLSESLNDEGAMAVDRGAVDDARRLFAEALKVNAMNAKASLNLGMLSEQLGDAEMAQNSILSAIKADPNFADAHFHLAHLKIHQSTDADVDRMKTLFASRSQTSKDKVMLAFGIGKALDKQSDYEQEFEWLKRAHKLGKAQEPFDLPATESQFQKLQDAFSQEVVAGTVSNSSANVLFVIGMPRSGTSLTEQILASHADVFGAGERMTGDKAINLFSKRHGAKSYPDKITTMSATELTDDAELLHADLATDAGGRPVIVDTTPSNFMHVGLLAMLYPRARFILCLRHPLDNCLSIYQHPLSELHAYAHGLSDLGAYYARYQVLVNHWRDILPDRIFGQQYEQVVDDFEASVRVLLNFCGLEFDSACVDFHSTQRIVKTPSASQVRQPIYSSSVGRWRRYEKQLDAMKIELEQALGVSLD